MTIVMPAHSDVSQLKLIWNNTKTLPSISEPLTLDKIIECVIQAIKTSDRDNRNKLESILAQIGIPALPYLVEGLRSDSLSVQSVCFMVLVRIGQPAAKDIIAFYRSMSPTESSRWVVEQLLQELNCIFPQAPHKRYAAASQANKVVALSNKA